MKQQSHPSGGSCCYCPRGGGKAESLTCTESVSRLADRSPLPPQLSGGCELTVVIHDFTACNSTELTIRRGQTVEVLERPHDKPDWCLVRTTDRSPAAEGLVPCGSLCIAHSRSSMEMEGIFNHKGRARGPGGGAHGRDPGALSPLVCSRVIGRTRRVMLQAIIAGSLGRFTPTGAEVELTMHLLPEVRDERLLSHGCVIRYSLGRRGGCSLRPVSPLNGEHREGSVLSR